MIIIYCFCFQNFEFLDKYSQKDITLLMQYYKIQRDRTVGLNDAFVSKETL